MKPFRFKVNNAAIIKFIASTKPNMCTAAWWHRSIDERDDSHPPIITEIGPCYTSCCLDPPCVRSKSVVIVPEFHYAYCVRIYTHVPVNCASITALLVYLIQQLIHRKIKVDKLMFYKQFQGQCWLLISVSPSII